MVRAFRVVRCGDQGVEQMKKSLLIGIANCTLILATLLTAGCKSRAVQPIVSTPAEQPIPTFTKILPTITPETLNTDKTLGYYTGKQESYDAVLAHAPYLKIISVDVFSVQMDGSLVGGDDFDIAAFNRNHDIQTFACVTNYNNEPDVNDFDPALAQAALVNHPQKVIAGIIDLLHTNDFTGVNIDFESLAFSEDIEEDRAAFTAFIYDLAGQLHTEGYRLIISVPGKTDDDPENTWSYPFDLAALGQDADYLQLMTYDQHGPWGEPGPVAGADWVEDCLVYTTSLVDPAKLLIGLPSYGYNWNLSASDPQNKTYSAESFYWIDIPVLLEKPGAELHWDENSQSPWLAYKQEGHEHVAWFENPDSIRIKTALVSKYHLAGLSMWSLGQEDESFWQAVVDGLDL